MTRENEKSPGPGYYDVGGKVLGGPQFKIGIKTELKGKQDKFPGPGEYTPEEKYKFARSPTFRVGTSSRPGLESTSQTPGPNRYNTARSTTSGPSYGFGTSVRSRALSQSQTGPGSYDLQTTIGMVPKYLLSKKDSNHRELPENEANFQVSLTKFTSLPQSLSGDQQNLFSGR
eukprot:TRINITY_DN12475_c0_g1_i4.p2 TRINITY_DN12475_c0_g1~~TRINITY_DN12475_c0_g1_i4.p2  ORF type:complete len:173 (-),score=9.34 TRINITY_DN12475_c0_g1_i4:275-793(-)